MIPVDEVALAAARDYVDEQFEYLSADEVGFDSRIGETSPDL